MKELDGFETEFKQLTEKYKLRAVFVAVIPSAPDADDGSLYSGGDAPLCRAVDAAIVTKPHG